VDADEFISKWQVSGGNERANTQMFVTDLCDLLGVERPRPTQSDTGHNDYVFERHVVKAEIDGTTSNGWIDLYKRDCFILEAKQGSAADAAAVDAGLGDSLRDLFGQTAAERFKRGMAKRGTEQWTGAMLRAAGQADGYARALPEGHGWPPFLLVSDIGFCIDVYANFARDGRPYAPFPDRRRFRITLDDLRDKDVRERLAALWTTPMSLDPSAEAARVTREVADYLATLARDIEKREQNADRVAAFLMRVLFTMFAEDTGLIPKKSFSKLMAKVRDRPENLKPQLSALWKAMDEGGFAGALGEAGETVRKFNGYLFKDTTAIRLEPNEIDVLIAAAASDWRQVEPAIFGTLLERALNPKERAKLGAHYTPRAYVERLVGPTIMEPLREDWLGARTAAMEAAEAGDREKARRLVEAFHTRLAQTKVLDPACGTGNFLYVAMARMKELEGEVLELLEELGDDRYLAELAGHTITPENFLGIEINPRAAEIAQLVLWIGYLQWHFRVNGEDRMPEPPVLRDVKTIECRDALIEWDKRELVRDENGRPVTRWDGTTMKPQPSTNRLIPDESARAEVYRYIQPRQAPWPNADFIVGNPPFIGCRRMRKRLSSPYVDALRIAYSDLSGEIDFVTYWWSRAARLVSRRQIRRFGLITTKTIAQSSNRSVLREHFENDRKHLIHLEFAIPNHPWHDQETTAAVRIAMTVGAAGQGSGSLWTIKTERRRRGETHLDFSIKHGRINVDLTIGPKIASATALKSNSKICWMGVKMSGDGFKINPSRRTAFERDGVPPDRMPRVIAGTDVSELRAPSYALDFFDLSQDELKTRYPTAYNHLLMYVKPERDQNDRESYSAEWWRFVEPRPRLRASTRDLKRYIVTSETHTHPIFTFVWNDQIIIDGSVIGVASEDAWILGVLSSRAHEVWALRAGGRQGVGDDPRYQNEMCFDPFPFPDTSDESLKARIRDAAEALDALRKDVLARHTDLTLTRLYNTLEALRAAEAAGTVLSEKERDIATRGCVSLIRQYHDEIDSAVAEAYGWDGWNDPHPSQSGEGQAVGNVPRGGDRPTGPTSTAPLNWRGLPDDIILECLVALNKERAAEEAKGKVRWLRPEFQAPDYVAPADQKKLALPEAERPTAEVIEWPAALPEQVVAVASVVARWGGPVVANDVARAFMGKRAASVIPVLDALAGMGRVRKLEDGRYAA
jgi:hypothetical protein